MKNTATKRKINKSKLTAEVAELLTKRQTAKKAEILAHFKTMLSQPTIDIESMQSYLTSVNDGIIFDTKITLVAKTDGTINPVSLPIEFRNCYNEVEKSCNDDKEQLLTKLKGKEDLTDEDITNLVELELSNPFKSKFLKRNAA